MQPETCTLLQLIDYCMKRVELLRRNSVEPVLIFDGGRLPMKASEEEARHRWAQI